MSGTDVLVIVAGIAAIAWVNWYFFVAGRRSEGASAEAGPEPFRRRRSEGEGNG
jgi:hypothetical protein